MTSRSAAMLGAELRTAAAAGATYTDGAVNEVVAANSERAICTESEGEVCYRRSGDQGPAPGSHPFHL